MNGSAVSESARSLDLRHNTSRKLRVDAARNPLGDLGGRWIQHETRDVVLGKRRCRAGEVIGERTAG